MFVKAVGGDLVCKKEGKEKIIAIVIGLLFQCNYGVLKAFYRTQI